MYARLHGVKEEHMKQVVNNMIDIMMLDKHADKLAGVYRLVVGGDMQIQG